jgi:nitroimidazol reductase NimA-like FMN-containing flavoprotein (pyridoxamine 5'-phosphate oxidase superfamily)
MLTYHLRRAEKAIEDQAKLLEIIQRQRYLTLAMCRENQPYLVILNYAYDPGAHCFYVHCASEGKKLDYLRANPTIWGQVLEDLGYVDGACDHAFRSIHVEGTATFVDDPDEKEHAVSLMIDQLESDPAAVKARALKPKAIEKVVIAKIIISAMTGKESLKPAD